MFKSSLLYFHWQNKYQEAQAKLDAIEAKALEWQQAESADASTAGTKASYGDQGWAVAMNECGNELMTLLKVPENEI